MSLVAPRGPPAGPPTATAGLGEGVAPRARPPPVCLRRAGRRRDRGRDGRHRWAGPAQARTGAAGRPAARRRAGAAPPATPPTATARWPGRRCSAGRRPVPPGGSRPPPGCWWQGRLRAGGRWAGPLRSGCRAAARAPARETPAPGTTMPPPSFSPARSGGRAAARETMVPSPTRPVATGPAGTFRPRGVPGSRPMSPRAPSRARGRDASVAHRSGHRDPVGGAGGSGRPHVSRERGCASVLGEGGVGRGDAVSR